MTAPAPFRIGFVCTGNICRSPMGEVVFRRLAEDAGLGDRFVVTSRGTEGWHAGRPAHEGTRIALAEAGYDGSAHRAARLSDADIAEHDLLIALARGHEAEMLARGADPERLALLTAFDPERPEDPDVFDPYWSEQPVYAEVLAQVERSCRALLAELRGRMEDGPRSRPERLP
ncbi:low molecular weight phosphotyrosine protein phosphatase [Leucobacter zeae]|nr:low molecular weight phosphotyrosine protein phosphatase [Leucobacter zeae]